MMTWRFCRSMQATREPMRADIFNYLKDLAQGESKRIRYKALRYVLIGNEIYYVPLKDHF